MKEVQVVSWDDWRLAQGGKVSAAGTVQVGYNGEWRELDVSKETREEFEEWLLPRMRAGHRPDQIQSPKAGTRGYKYRPGAKADRQALRDWADEQVAADPSLAEVYSYITAEGRKRIAEGKSPQYYYPARLKEDYAAAMGVTGPAASL